MLCKFTFFPLFFGGGGGHWGWVGLGFFFLLCHCYDFDCSAMYSQQRNLFLLDICPISLGKCTDLWIFSEFQRTLNFKLVLFSCNTSPTHTLGVEPRQKTLLSHWHEILTLVILNNFSKRKSSSIVMLILAEVELIFFIVATMGLCFGFVLGTVLTGHQCL